MISTIVRKARTLLPQKSVAGILSVFTKTIDELEALAVRKQEEADAKEQKAQDLLAQVEDAEDEAFTARSAADSIRNMLGDCHPAVESAMDNLDLSYYPR